MSDDLAPVDARVRGSHESWPARRVARARGKAYAFILPPTKGLRTLIHTASAKNSPALYARARRAADQQYCTEPRMRLARMFARRSGTSFWRGLTSAAPTRRTRQPMAPSLCRRTTAPPGHRITARKQELRSGALISKSAARGRRLSQRGAAMPYMTPRACPCSTLRRSTIPRSTNVDVMPRTRACLQRLSESRRPPRRSMALAGRETRAGRRSSATTCHRIPRVRTRCTRRGPST